MTAIIHKYKLRITDLQTIEMPRNAEVLTLQAQSDIPCLWAIVDLEAPMESRTFRMFTADDPANGVDSMLYVGTFQVFETFLAFHVFEVRA